jgi:hypothetical protein
MFIVTWPHTSAEECGKSAPCDPVPCAVSDLFH